MKKVSFPTDLLKELASLEVDEEEQGYTVVQNQMYDTSRWSIHYQLIFEKDGRFFKAFYSCGATEQQDESPFEYSGKEYDCLEVVPFIKTVTDYKPV